MKILAIPATNSTSSINRQLLAYGERVLRETSADITVETVDLNDHETAIYSVDREQADGIPEEAKTLFAKIGSADAVVVSFAEHNGSYTAAWKNIFDWMSRIDAGVFQSKPVALLAASPGGRGGAGVLSAASSAAPFAGAEVVGQLGVGQFPQVFDSEAIELTDADLDGQYRALLDSLVAAAK